MPSRYGIRSEKLLVDKLESMLSGEEGYSELNIKNFLFVPEGERSIDFSSKIEHIRQQNRFLSEHREIVALASCPNIDERFMFTQKFRETLDAPGEMVGKIYTLRFLLNNITIDGEKVIVSIDRDTGGNQDRYTLLTNQSSASFLREQVLRVVPLLRETQVFKEIRVGGSPGTYRTQKGQIQELQQSPYLKRLRTEQVYRHKPERENDRESDEDTQTSGLNQPPTTATSRRNPRGAGGAPAVLDYSNRHVVQSY